MSNTSSNAPMLPSVITQDDEIDLIELLRNIWQQRGLVLGVALFSVLIVLAFHVGKGAFATAKKVEQPVSLIFLNSEGLYPNGTAFSPRDIVSRRVLSVVATQHDMNVDVLTPALAVEYSNSLLQASEEKLSTMLANAKTPDDVRLATRDMLAQLRAETRRVATLSVDLGKANLTAEEGKVLLQSILVTWSQQAIQRGLMNTDVSYPVSPYQPGETKNLIDTYDDLRKYAVSLQLAIQELRKLSGSQSLVVNQQSLVDLNRVLQTIMHADINPLRTFAYSNSSAIYTQDPNMRVRVQSRQRLLDLEHERIGKLIASYDTTLQQLAKSDENLASGSGAAGGQALNAQFDQSFLDSLLNLGNKLSSVEIREELYKKRTQAIEEKLDLEKEIEILRGLHDDSRTERDVLRMLQTALQEIVVEVNEVQQQLSEFIVAYRQQTLNSGANLYIADAAPQVRGGVVQLGKKVVLSVAVGLILGLMLGVVAALVRSAMRKA